MRRALALLVVAGCRTIAGIPEAELSPADGATPDARRPIDGAADAPADAPLPDAPDVEARCDGVDDDLDGVVDEGIPWIELPGTRRVLDRGEYAGIWWSARGPDRVALAWTTGPGTAADVTKVQVFDLAGAPVAPAVALDTFQPWTVHQLVWRGDRVLLSATQRSYACGGDLSTACETYVVAVQDDGALVVPPTSIGASAPTVVAAPGGGDAYDVVRLAPSGAGDVRARAYDRDGAVLGLERTIYTTSPGERTNLPRISALDGANAWIYSSTTTGLSLRLVDPTDAITLGPVTIDDTPGASVIDRSGAAIALVPEGYAIAVNRAGAPAIVFVSPAGGRLREVPIPGADVLSGLVRVGDELVVLATTNLETGPQGTIWRLALDGRIAAAPTPLGFEGAHRYGTLAPVPGGVLIAAADYGEGITHPISLARFACP